MDKPVVKFQKIRDVQTPKYSTDGSAGIDFFIPYSYTHRTIEPGESLLIPAGIKVKMPEGYALVGFNKSGIATKKGLILGACVIDNDYQGEIHIHVRNVGHTNTWVSPGLKLAQFILLQTPTVELVEVSVDLYTTETARGEGGFGSTGNE